MDTAVPLPVIEKDQPVVADPASTLSENDVRHNVRVNVLVAAIFQIGAADMALVAGPLLVFLLWFVLSLRFFSPFLFVACWRRWENAGAYS